jgi:pilus assembly protein Flp/PilA
MERLKKRLGGWRSWFLGERGASAVEYGIMVAAIAAVIISAVVFLGTATSNNFDCTKRSISAQTNQC